MCRFRPITHQQIRRSRQAFEEHEPRDLFYRVATELVERALGDHEETSLSITEAIGVLLQTWNRSYYQYHQHFDAQHFREVEHLISEYLQSILDFRDRAIESFCRDDEEIIGEIFPCFEIVLGPVGAAKCLHLLAPRFFPLWDRAIARNYCRELRESGRNAQKYCCFMRIVQEQVNRLGGETSIHQNPLKAIDEYNYCRYTKHWIE